MREIDWEWEGGWSFESLFMERNGFIKISAGNALCEIASTVHYQDY